ncbi:MAG: c-type cytochrome biogenesis protein CcmI, partial [Hyphomicrobiaceae bacterium]
MVWISFAILTALVLAVVLRPLARSLSGPTDDQTLDIAVYRDQLDEVKAESERGVLPKAEAEQARTEIARRLLNAARR